MTSVVELWSSSGNGSIHPIWSKLVILYFIWPGSDKSYFSTKSLTGLEASKVAYEGLVFVKSWVPKYRRLTLVWKFSSISSLYPLYFFLHWKCATAWRLLHMQMYSRRTASFILWGTFMICVIIILVFLSFVFSALRRICSLSLSHWWARTSVLQCLT